MRRSRKDNVKKGIEPISAMRRIRGDSASKKGLEMRRSVERVRTEDVACISWGKRVNRLDVIKARMRGMSEKRRKLKVCQSCPQFQNICMVTHPTVSPHVGSVPSSHMKLPMNAQMAEIVKVAGIKTEVANNTGFTNILNSMM